MRVQISRFKSKGLKFNQVSGLKSKILKLLTCCYIILIFLIIKPFAFGAEKWSGVDESVVEKFAKEHGREAREPLINTDQGDLLLFVFLLAGTAGGFVAGYYWRELTVDRKKQRTDGNI
jgi:ABC-type cobalt transport system substrate-binding protein